MSICKAIAKRYTPILQQLARIAIGHDIHFFGQPCKIYYPKNVGRYSGTYDDIEYNAEPDLVTDLAVIGLQGTQHKTAYAGVLDHLFQSEYTIYLKHDSYIPLYSRIDILSDTEGLVSVIVRDSESANNLYGNIYRKLTCLAFASHKTNDSESIELRDSLAKEHEEELHNLDTTEDFATTRSDPKKIKHKYREIK